MLELELSTEVVMAGEVVEEEEAVVEETEAVGEFFSLCLPVVSAINQEFWIV